MMPPTTLSPVPSAGAGPSASPLQHQAPAFYQQAQNAAMATATATAAAAASAAAAAAMISSSSQTPSTAAQVLRSHIDYLQVDFLCSSLGLFVDCPLLDADACEMDAVPDAETRGLCHGRHPQSSCPSSACGCQGEGKDGCSSDLGRFKYRANILTAGSRRFIIGCVNILPGKSRRGPELCQARGMHANRLLQGLLRGFTCHQPANGSPCVSKTNQPTPCGLLHRTPAKQRTKCAVFACRGLNSSK